MYLYMYICIYVFSNLGGLTFLLLCNYSIDRIPVALSNFHKQALLAWSLIYKHNFSPTKYFIWNNKDICFKRKSLFLNNWFNNDIILVSQLFNKEGQLFNYQEFVNHFKVPVTPKQFAIVFDAIPTGVVMLYRAYSSPLSAVKIVNDPLDTPVGKLCFDQKNNRKIRSLFQNDCVSVSYVIALWNNIVNDICWVKTWSLPNRYLLTNKVKEISFKIIHRYYPVKTVMVRYKKDIDVTCTLCNMHPETVYHLFWTCESTRSLWQGICRFILDNIHDKFVLCFKDVIFGFTLYEQKFEKEFYLCNLIILLAKFYIHKCKFLNTRPVFCAFKKELELYIKTLSTSSNQKAVKTIMLCSKFELFTEIE
ncbi:uncharacterized protein LOC133659905 [Entelurus aequoreus]|uniref:uncharacterized protein LOC133659905 n=1 Tax=Entelurus aequoreus TaxID=161455 RepID=UPI002B1D80B4|nr:uncharacterized protein LOC133659905 [Entelurus aequoreus]XP_061918734.1 uncharacterized protein LOC133659905 [Entelurus aequoreus]XP_061918735.1 uncharacterized protein LOC133659905 [Entelurus aequoreus]